MNEHGTVSQLHCCHVVHETLKSLLLVSPLGTPKSHLWVSPLWNSQITLTGFHHLNPMQVTALTGFTTWNSQLSRTYRFHHLEPKSHLWVSPLWNSQITLTGFHHLEPQVTSALTGFNTWIKIWKFVSHFYISTLLLQDHVYRPKDELTMHMVKVRVLLTSTMAHMWHNVML